MGIRRGIEFQKGLQFHRLYLQNGNLGAQKYSEIGVGETLKTEILGEVAAKG